jgi:uncharacterized protein (DUF302 family)
VDNNEQGLVTVPSRYSFPETLEKILAAIQQKGLKVFSIVDHSGEAEKVGLTMRPTQLVIFGAPKGGTPVMVAAPTAAIDLPLKTLVWQDEEGKVLVTFNSADYLAERHGIPDNLVKNISGVGALVQKALE